MDRKMCAYCGLWFDIKKMTPLYEKGISHTLWYCEEHYPLVRNEINSFSWRNKLSFGQKGVDKNPFI